MSQFCRFSGSVSSSSGLSSGPHDTEAAYDEEDDLGDEWEPRPSRERRRRSTSGDDAILENIEWDDDLTPAPSSETRQYDFPIGDERRVPSPDLEDEEDVPTPRAAPGERTPLLIRPSPSTTSLGRPAAGNVGHVASPYAAVQRKISSASVRQKAPEAKYHVGQSTFTQTVRTLPHRTRHRIS